MDLGGKQEEMKVPSLVLTKVLLDLTLPNTMKRADPFSRRSRQVEVVLICANERALSHCHKDEENREEFLRGIMCRAAASASAARVLYVTKKKFKSPSMLRNNNIRFANPLDHLEFLALVTGLSASTSEIDDLPDFVVVDGLEHFLPEGDRPKRAIALGRALLLLRELASSMRRLKKSDEFKVLASAVLDDDANNVEIFVDELWTLEKKEFFLLSRDKHRLLVDRDDDGEFKFQALQD